MKKLAKQFLGFSIAAIGVLWILNVTGVIGFDIFFRGWWTLLIILPCTAHLIAHPNWGSFSGIALGAILLLQAQGYICLLYTSPSPRDSTSSRMPSSA